MAAVADLFSNGWSCKADDQLIKVEWSLLRCIYFSLPMDLKQFQSVFFSSSSFRLVAGLQLWWIRQQEKKKRKNSRHVELKEWAMMGAKTHKIL